MMNKKKILTSLVLGTAMVSQVAVPVFAKEQTNTTPNENAANPNEWKADSHTTIGITEVGKDDLIDGDLDKTTNVSFEVPLYVTTAAISGKTVLAAPKTYDIQNNGTRGIVVTRMQIEKLANSTWSTVEDDTEVENDAKNVKLAIGGLTMPATKQAGEKVDAKLAVTGTNNAFTTGEKYNVIEKGGKTLSTSEANKAKDINKANRNDADTANIGLAIVGKVKNVEDRQNKAAASQFRVTYVVSAITKKADENIGDGTVDKDKIVGFTYVGDDKAAAGLAK